MKIAKYDRTQCNSEQQLNRLSLRNLVRLRASCSELWLLQKSPIQSIYPNRKDKIFNVYYNDNLERQSGNQFQSGLVYFVCLRNGLEVRVRTETKPKKRGGLEEEKYQQFSGRTKTLIFLECTEQSLKQGVTAFHPSAPNLGVSCFGYFWTVFLRPHFTTKLLLHILTLARRSMT